MGQNAGAGGFFLSETLVPLLANVATWNWRHIFKENLQGPIFLGTNPQKILGQISSFQRQVPWDLPLQKLCIFAAPKNSWKCQWNHKILGAKVKSPRGKRVSPVIGLKKKGTNLHRKPIWPMGFSHDSRPNHPSDGTFGPFFLCLVPVVASSRGHCSCSWPKRSVNL